MGQIRVDDMSVEQVCTGFRDFRAKCVGAVSKNVFCKNRPHGGARRGPCEKFQMRGCGLAAKECVCKVWHG